MNVVLVRFVFTGLCSWNVDLTVCDLNKELQLFETRHTAQFSEQFKGQSGFFRFDSCCCETSCFLWDFLLFGHSNWRLRVVMISESCYLPATLQLRLQIRFSVRLTVCAFSSASLCPFFSTYAFGSWRWYSPYRSGSHMQTACQSGNQWVSNGAVNSICWGESKIPEAWWWWWMEPVLMWIWLRCCCCECVCCLGRCSAFTKKTLSHCHMHL